MEKYTKILLLIIAILLFYNIININYINNNISNIDKNNKNTIIENIDTIYDTIPNIKYQKMTKYIHDTLYQVTTKYDTLSNEIIEKKDTSLVEADIPITQKIYTNDSTYTAWVSGYKASLDSISIYTKTKTVKVKDKTHWGIGPVIYGGYDASHNKIGCGIGIGITYNLIKW